MPTYDRGRQLDLAKLQAKINDPATSDAERRRIEEAKYAIRNQSEMKSVGKLREALLTAQRRGETDKVERLTHQAEYIDRDFTKVVRQRP